MLNFNGMLRLTESFMRIDFFYVSGNEEDQGVRELSNVSIRAASVSLKGNVCFALA